jgi:hypothetical protein
MMLRLRRIAALVVVAGTAAAIAGTAGSAPPAVSQATGAVTLADTQTAVATLAYACRFPAGTYQVGARLTASYPATALAGRSVRPASLSLVLTVPAAPLASLGQPGAAIAVAARLATSGPRGTAPAVVWASLATPAAPQPAAGGSLGSGPLRPTAPLPSLSADQAGRMTVTAGNLALVFTPRGTVTTTPTATATPSASASATATPSATVTPSATGTSSPSPARPPVTATCTLEQGQDAALATIAVRGAPATHAAQASSPCPPLPGGGLKLNPDLPKPPKPPRGSTVTYPPPQDHACAYITGYSDVRKLNGAALVGPGLINVSVGVRLVLNIAANYYQEDSAGQLDYTVCRLSHRHRTCQVIHGFPPATATFLDFGFMPVTATLQLTEIGTLNIYGVGTGFALSTNTSWAQMNLRIYDVKVNGKPLNVGPDCETSKPLLIGLTGLGSGPHPYSLSGGGPLTGYVTVPAFSHCGVSENLDDLITGTVSGTDNYSEFTQGPLCDLIQGQVCPPQRPRPLR